MAQMGEDEERPWRGDEGDMEGTWGTLGWGHWWYKRGMMKRGALRHHRQPWRGEDGDMEGTKGDMEGMWGTLG